jgi:hypothetical protein
MIEMPAFILRMVDCAPFPLPLVKEEKKLALSPGGGGLRWEE